MRARRDRGGNGVKGAIWIGSLALIAIALAFGFYWIKRDAGKHATDESGCLKQGLAPQAALFMIDTTDRLSTASAGRVLQEIREVIKGMPRYSRVAIVPFGDDQAAPFPILFGGCLPGRAEDARPTESERFLGEDFKKFEASLDQLGDKLASLQDAETSPITRQVVRAASDPTLKWEGDQKLLILITDGLESSVFWTRDLRLADPPRGLLDDVCAEYFEVGNERSNRLQTPQLREQWREWFEKSGASIRIFAPGYRADRALGRCSS